MAGTCTECGAPAKAKGLCSGHYNRAHYLANADHAKARAREWYRQNPDQAQARRDRRDPDRLAAIARAYYWNNRLKCIARRANDKAKELGIAGTLTAEAIEARFAYFGGRCWICGAPDAKTVDHIKPLGKRGLNIAANIRPACGSCNSRRSWEGRRH